MTDIHHLEDQDIANARSAEPDPLARFIEQMGLLCERDNPPRIAGRVLGLLVIEE